MMSLSEALARNRLFWVTYIKRYGNSIIYYRKILLFREIFPHLYVASRPSCIACHYNLERIGDYCAGRCIIPWTGGGLCTNSLSPYDKGDAQGVLDCIDEAIKKYDKKRGKL